MSRYCTYTYLHPLIIYQKSVKLIYNHLNFIYSYLDSQQLFGK